MNDTDIDQEQPDVNESEWNDTRLSVENIHADHVIVEPNLKLKAETEVAIIVEGDNGINVYCHQDGEEEKTVDIFYMDADKKTNFLLYLNRMEDTDVMCVLDSGSAVNVLKTNYCLLMKLELVKASIFETHQENIELLKVVKRWRLVNRGMTRTNS